MKTPKKLPYPLRVLSHGARLPSYIAYFEGKFAQVDQSVDVLKSTVVRLEAELKETNRLLASYQKLDDRVTDITHQLSMLLDSNSTRNTPTKTVNDTVSDNHRFDQFYKAFEDKFRGPEDIIKNRVKEHIPIFEALSKENKKKPIIDIGCGRGEMLSVLKDNNFTAIGIDMNESMVNRAIEMGYQAVNTDALSYLKTLDKNSTAAVTGFHIVEHIPFEPLMEIFAECYRVLDRGGFVLFETPNPETLKVGSHSFYLDPSHLKPVPPQLLSFMLEYIGFECEIQRIHPIDTLSTTVKSAEIKKLHSAVFGPADYAVIGRKL